MSPRSGTLAGHAPMGLPWPSGAWPASMPAIPAQAYLHAACWKGAATPRPARKQNSDICVVTPKKLFLGGTQISIGPLLRACAAAPPAGRVEAPEERAIPAGCRVRRVRPWMAYCAVPSLQVPERGYPEPRRRDNAGAANPRPARKQNHPNPRPPHRPIKPPSNTQPYCVAEPPPFCLINVNAF